ncbi:MAG TPA: hypothetical protein VGH87_00860 [Polyangiaceae bacterium]|jgi:CheY-like chemotaxis protein|nr:hypothetical protein [Polyangiaceae bacterium]
METILVASDDVVLVNRLDWLLHEAGFDVTMVSTVAAARTALAKWASTFSLVIADVRLPDHANLVDLVGDVPIVVLGDPPLAVRERIAKCGGAVIDEPYELTFHGRLVGALH